MGSGADFELSRAAASLPRWRRVSRDSDRTVRGVSREAAIADYGVVLTRELGYDLESHDAAAADAARISRPARAEVFFDRGPRYVRLSGGMSFADVDIVAS